MRRERPMSDTSEGILERRTLAFQICKDVGLSVRKLSLDHIPIYLRLTDLQVVFAAEILCVFLERH